MSTESCNCPVPSQGNAERYPVALRLRVILDAPYQVIIVIVMIVCWAMGIVPVPTAS